LLSHEITRDLFHKRRKEKADSTIQEKIEKKRGYEKMNQEQKVKEMG